MAKVTGTMDKVVKYLENFPGEQVPVIQIMAALNLPRSKVKGALNNAEKNSYIDIDVEREKTAQARLISAKLKYDGREAFMTAELAGCTSPVEIHLVKKKQGIAKAPWLFKWAA